ncbi:MAG: tetratricopeptide repeat protein [Polyangiaceae bacterium]
MNLRSVTQSAFSLVAVASMLAFGGCSRDHIEAINRANEGDQAVKVNVEGAIQKYEEAVQLDPTNHRILRKLGNAYEKKEDWDKMASTMARAVQVAPDFADYWFKRGYALIKQAENGNPDAYNEAKEPLKKCIEKDANFAECYYFLGQANLWTLNDQEALANYTKAIEHDPVNHAMFYPPLGELYVNLRYYKEAEQVLQSGDESHQAHRGLRQSFVRHVRASLPGRASEGRQARNGRLNGTRAGSGWRQASGDWLQSR